MEFQSYTHHRGFRTLGILIIYLFALFQHSSAHKKTTDPKTPGNNPKSVCSSITSLLPKGNVLLPQEAAYNTSIASYAFANQQTQRPACIVRPRNAADVSSVIKLLRNTPSVRFAVRSGGHATNAEFSNIDGGITIDLTSINSVELQKDGVTVSIGTGATWGSVYSVLDARGRSLNGGRASNVGVGGFLSGGGVGFFAFNEGFACDAVVNMQVVLSNGDLVNANAKSHKDLFVALKGGQSNFGIATRWDVTTISKGQVWGGAVLYPNTTTPAQLAAFTKWKSPKGFDSASSVEQSHVYLGAFQLSLVSTHLFYAKPRPFPENLKPFTSIEPQLDSTLRLSNVTDFAREIQSQNSVNQYVIFATTTLKISPTILTKVHTIWQSAVQKMTRNNAIVTSSMTFQSIPSPPPPSDPSRANSLGFKPGSTPQKDQVLILLSNFWEAPSISKQVEQATKEFIQDVERVAKKEGVWHPFVYENYAAKGFQDPLKSTGNLAELRKVAKKYDPDGMFQEQVVGGWKLW